jgi:hypothetical protein
LARAVAGVLIVLSSAGCWRAPGDVAAGRLAELASLPALDRAGVERVVGPLSASPSGALVGSSPGFATIEYRSTPGASTLSLTADDATCITREQLSAHLGELTTSFRGDPDRGAETFVRAALGERGSLQVTFVDGRRCLASAGIIDGAPPSAPR